MFPRPLRMLSDDERGLSLVMALLVLFTLAGSAAAIVAVSSAGFRSSAYQRASETALPAAEAGLAEGLSRLVSASNPRLSTLLPATTITIEAASVTYSGSYTAATDRWTITSTATSANPTAGTAPVSRTVQQTYAITAPQQPLSQNPAWGYLFAASPTGCTMFDSSVSIRQPVYVTSDLCMDSSTFISSEANTVQVGGKINIISSATIGTSASAATRVPVLRVAGAGCRYGILYGSPGAYAYPCTSAHKVWATTQINSVTGASKPPIDLAGAYAGAKPGPRYGCTTSSGTPPVFDNDAVMNGSAGNQNLMPGSSYDCVVTIGGQQVGRLRWQYGTPGTLTIDGVVFIDGSVRMVGSETGRVVGRGTVYAYNQIYLDSSVQLCGRWDASASTCDWANWNPDVDGHIVLVGGSGGGAADSVYMNGSVRIQASLYGVNDASTNSSVITQGPIIARQLYIDSSVTSLFKSFLNLPPGAPSNGLWAVSPVPGTWRES